MYDPVLLRAGPDYTMPRDNVKAGAVLQLVSQEAALGFHHLLWAFTSTELACSLVTCNINDLNYTITLVL